MTAKHFLIRVEADFYTDVDEVWPDGDAPAEPTADDVREVIRKSGGVVRFIEEWTLDQSGLLVTVDGKPVEW